MDIRRLKKWITINWVNTFQVLWNRKTHSPGQVSFKWEHWGASQENSLLQKAELPEIPQNQQYPGSITPRQWPVSFLLIHSCCLTPWGMYSPGWIRQPGAWPIFFHHQGLSHKIWLSQSGTNTQDIPIGIGTRRLIIKICLSFIFISDPQMEISLPIFS